MYIFLEIKMGEYFEFDEIFKIFGKYDTFQAKRRQNYMFEIKVSGFCKTAI